MTATDRAIALLAAAARLPASAISPATTIGDLPEWDSVAHVHLMLAIEEALGRELEPKEISGMISVSAIMLLLDGDASRQP